MSRKLKNAIKYVVGKTYKPLLVKYLSKTRSYSYKGIHLEIPPEVFHPGYFFSTKLLLKCISGLPLQQKTFLEPGAGSGLISIFAAKQGALVTATDINPVAVEYLKESRVRNQVQVNVLLADLFDKVPRQAFDIIAINPPYYKKEPLTPADYAWYCGENGEYFEKLFRSLHDYIHADSIVYMVLCNGCDLGMICFKANRFHFKMECILSKQTILEKNFVYKIEKIK